MECTGKACVRLGEYVVSLECVYMKSILVKFDDYCVVYYCGEFYQLQKTVYIVFSMYIQLHIMKITLLIKRKYNLY